MSAVVATWPERVARAGALRRFRGDPVRAEPLLRAALVATEKAFPHDVLRLAHALNELGLVYKDLARYDEAQDVYERALGLLSRQPGAHSDEIATLEHNLGGIGHARGDWACAEDHARKGLELRRASCAGDDLALAADLTALGAILDARGKHLEAERLYLDALAIFDRAPDANALEIAVVYNDLGASYAQRGMPCDAADMLERAAALKRRILGPRHHSLGRTLNNLAVVHERLGDYERAAELYATSVNIMKRSLGADHPATAACRQSEARCLAVLQASRAG